MSSTFQKDELTWRDILIRSAIVIITVIVVVWALPHDNISYFYVEEGKPWKYADFTAPFDFPIYKSEKAINEERDSAMRNYEPYYNYNKDTELRMVNKFNTDYADGIPGLPKSFIVIISNRLHSLYQQGIMEQEEYNKLHKDTTQMIRVVNGKEANKATDEQINRALTAINGKDKPLKHQQAFLGICCYLASCQKWPQNKESSVSRINKLPDAAQWEIPCKWESIRKFSGYKFAMTDYAEWDDYTPRDIERTIFYECRDVARAFEQKLKEEMKK